MELHEVLEKLRTGEIHSTHALTTIENHIEIIKQETKKFTPLNAKEWYKSREKTAKGTNRDTTYRFFRKAEINQTQFLGFGNWKELVQAITEHKTRE